MAAGGTTQTVYGFCADVDWWPTVFEDAFSPNAVCSACGLVCSMSGSLPCCHVLCRRCYRKCADGERCWCPLDERAHPKEDVIWTTLTAESLLCRKIRCWNTGNGCSVVGTVLEILEHFNTNCHYYAIPCPRCRRTVAQKDVIDHLVSGNCGQGQQAPPTIDGVGANSLLQSLQSFDKKLTESIRLSMDTVMDIHEKQTSLESKIAVRHFPRQEIDGILGQLESRIAKMCTKNTSKVLKACSSIETVTSALRAASVTDKKDARKTWKELHESIHKISGSEELLHLIKELGEKFSIAMAASQAILENKLCSSEALEWSVNGWSKLKGARNRGETAVIWAENPGFFYGYYILPGAEITNIQCALSLRLVFRICGGIYDHLLSWPFVKEVHFKVLHPNERKYVVCKSVSTTNLEDEILQMPSTVQGRFLIAGNGIPIRTLETNGYNINDKIRVRFEVLP